MLWAKPHANSTRSDLLIVTMLPKLTYRTVLGACVSGQYMVVWSWPLMLGDQAREWLCGGPIGKTGMGKSCWTRENAELSSSSNELQMIPLEDIVSLIGAARKSCCASKGRSFTFSGESSGTSSSNLVSEMQYNTRLNQPSSLFIINSWIFKENKALQS